MGPQARRDHSSMPSSGSVPPSSPARSASWMMPFRRSSSLTGSSSSNHCVRSTSPGSRAKPGACWATSLRVSTASASSPVATRRPRVLAAWPLAQLGAARRVRRSDARRTASAAATPASRYRCRRSARGPLPSRRPPPAAAATYLARACSQRSWPPSARNLQDVAATRDDDEVTFPLGEDRLTRSAHPAKILRTEGGHMCRVASPPLDLRRKLRRRGRMHPWRRTPRADRCRSPRPHHAGPPIHRRR